MYKAPWGEVSVRAVTAVNLPPDSFDTMDNAELLNTLKNITDRLAALETPTGPQDPSEDNMSEDNGPHDEVSWETVLPQSLTMPSDTTAIALASLCCMPPHWTTLRRHCQRSQSTQTYLKLQPRGEASLIKHCTNHSENRKI